MNSYHSLKSDTVRQKSPLYESNAYMNKLNINSSIGSILKKSAVNGQSNQITKHHINKTLSNSHYDKDFERFKPKLQFKENRETTYLDKKVSELTLKIQKIELVLKRHQVRICDFENLQYKDIKRSIEQMQTNKTVEGNYIDNTIKQLKNEIACCKKQGMKQPDFQSELFNIQTSIRSAITSMRVQLNQFSEKNAKQKKIDKQKIMMEVKQIVNKTQQSFDKKVKFLQANVNFEQRFVQYGNITSSQKPYFGRVSIFRYLQKLAIQTNQQQNKQNIITQKVFKIDKDGYLLDSNNFYLLDSNQKQIKLDQEHLIMLKKMGIFQ